MTDKTLGAYKRHEPRCRNDDGRLYCSATSGEFACSREPADPGPHVAATCDVQHSIREVWGQAERHEKHDAPGPLEQAADRLIAFVRPDQAPVRECPDPEQHRTETHPGGLSASEWKILAVSYGREMDSAREYAEEAGEFAALWKEVARRLSKRVHGLGWERDQYRAGEEEAEGRADRWHTSWGVADRLRKNAEKRAALWKETARRAIQRQAFLDSAAAMEQQVAMSESLVAAEAIARAEKAERERDGYRQDALTEIENRRVVEKERDEALRTVQEVVDSHDETLREIAEGKYAAESRPLTPDAITDQFVDYVHEDYFWSTEDRVRLEKPALKHALLDAVKRLAEASARPEGAEEIEAVLRDEWAFSEEDGGVEAFADLARRLAERGVRVATEGGAA